MSTPKLDNITVKGFKSLASVEKLALRPINVLIGPNGAGKSNFIEVFALLHALVEGRLKAYVAKAGGADRLLHFGAKETPAIEIRLTFSGGMHQYAVSLQSNAVDQLFPSDELVPSSEAVYPLFGDPHLRPFQENLAPRGEEAGISDSDPVGVAAWVRRRTEIERWRVYHFHDTGPSSPMKKTADLHDNRFLRPDASNLSAFLYLIQREHRDSYELIRSAVQLVTPFFDDFLLEPSKLSPDKIRLEWRHKNSDKYFDASSLSDGTLRFIALATIFLQPEAYRPSVILVDEPELGLHPYALAMLASLIKMAAEKTQVIVSTQSPMLLDHFAPEDVLVADRVADGTQFTRLDSAKLDSWLEEYSLGQLWEKNELGGRPAGG